MRSFLAIALSFALLCVSHAAQRELQGAVAELGGTPQDWDGPWTIFEPADGILDVQPVADGGPGELAIHVASKGEPDAGTTRHSSGLFRALNPLSPKTASGAHTLRFTLWLDDADLFKKRGSAFGFASTDLGEIAALSSRSSWNLICFGAPTQVGEVRLEAGELGLRTIQDGGNLGTIATGILMETLTPVQVALTIRPGSATFDIRIAQEDRVFESAGLGFWTQQPDFGPRFFNAFFSANPRYGFSIYLSDLAFIAGED